MNSVLLLNTVSIFLKSPNNYLLRWFAYTSLLSRFLVLINYTILTSNLFSVSSCLPRFSWCSFFKVQVFQGPVAWIFSALNLQIKDFCMLYCLRTRINMIFSWFPACFKKIIDDFFPRDSRQEKTLCIELTQFICFFLYFGWYGWHGRHMSRKYIHQQ